MKEKGRKLVKAVGKFLMRFCYARCLFFAWKIKKESGGRKVLVADNQKDDKVICAYLKLMGVPYYMLPLKEALQYVRKNDLIRECYLWVTMCKRLRKKISLFIDSGMAVEDIHYFYFNIPQMDINLPQDFFDAQLGFTREDSHHGFTVWGGKIA